jgi:hypothetical protein
VSRDPNDRIRTTTLLALVSLALLARDLLRIRRWAGQARDLTREHAHANAKSLNDLDAAHSQRITDLERQNNKLLEELRARGPRAAEPPSQEPTADES